jgi:hypothetical protein
MIDMLQAAQKQASRSGSYVGDILHSMYKQNYPNAYIPSRPCRLLHTAERIAAPISKGASSCGDQYMDTLWIPRVRTLDKSTYVYMFNSQCMTCMEHENTHPFIHTYFR